MSDKKNESKAQNLESFLNKDVELTLAAVKTGTTHCQNMSDLVNAVNLTKASIKEYVDGFASAAIAGGMTADSVKVLKSNRKCILEFSCALRKGQEDKLLWSGENCKKLVTGFAEKASDIASLAAECRKQINAENDDETESAYDLAKQLAKFQEKASDAGYNAEAILNQLLIANEELIKKAA